MKKRPGFDVKKAIYPDGNPVYLAGLQDKFTVKVAKFFYDIGFTANLMTLTTFIIAISSILVLLFVRSYTGLVIAAILVFLRNIGDMADGKIARGSNSKSAIGGFSDLISDWIIFLPAFFITLGYITGHIVIGFLCVMGYMSREFTRTKFTYFHGKKITETKEANEIPGIVSIVRKYDLGSTFILMPLFLILINPLWIIYAVFVIEYTLLSGELIFDYYCFLKTKKRENVPDTSGELEHY